MKKTVIQKVPVGYKWVVEDLCGNCDAKTVGASVPAGTPLPPAPVAGARLKYEVASGSVGD
jgi:hypothetical protein